MLKKIIVLFIFLQISFYSHYIELLWAEETTLTFVKELNQSIVVLPTVYAPNPYNKPMREYLINQDLHWAKDVLDIGTGTGVLSFIVLKAGAKQVIATDINAQAVKNATVNAQRLGYEHVFHARLVPANQSEAFSVIKTNEKFDLIISNPPWYEDKPKNIQDYAWYDANYALLYSIIQGLSNHLKKDGKAWLEIGSPEAVSVIMKESIKNHLNVKSLFSSGASYVILELSRNDQ